MSDKISLVVDVDKRQPACVLLQAAYGCGENNGLLKELFDSSCWLIAPTPGMHRVEGTREQWEGFAKECAEKHPLPDFKYERHLVHK